MNLYALGILWALGQYVEEPDESNKFCIRHQTRYFHSVVRRELGIYRKVKTTKQLHHRTGKIQYKTKIRTKYFDVTALEKLGWSPRLAEQRNYPGVSEHRDFLRAYIELHGVVDIRLAWDKPKTEKIKYPRLRIYGNRHFLEELSEVLNVEIGVTVKKVQRAGQSEVSGILYYQSKAEVLSIYNYLYRQPAKYFYSPKKEEFWEILNITNSITN